jgi:spore germination protein
LYLTSENRQLYEDFTRKLENRLKSEGYYLFVTITPLVIIQNNLISFEKINYSELGQSTDGIMIMSYNWGYNYGPPVPIISIASMKEFLDYAVTLIPNEKIDLGFSLIGYVWELPYIIGTTKASSLTIDSTIALARQHGTYIEFDEISQTPYFRYVDESSGVPRNYIVRFIDSRSIEAITELVSENGTSGIGLWNIMQYFPQLWLVINSQYQIETILP